MNKHELSIETVNIIKNSAILITSNDIKISLRMYEILFSRYPHYERLFAGAPENQYMKLAEALSAYAVNIDNLDVLAPALKNITNMHRRAGVTQMHYIAVGKSLMTAIEDTLGSTATPRFLDAWRDAYMYLSSVLIEMES